MNIETAIITGGSRGIGKAICIALAKDGFHVVINYLSNDSEANTTLNSIKEFNGSAELLKFDVSDKTDVYDAISNWIENNKDKKIKVLVNNAGIRKDNLLIFMSNEDWTSVINTNMNSFFYVTAAVLREMLLSKYGRIINIVSLSGLKGLPGQTNYSAAKGGIIAATKALAQEVGKKNVTVNAVAPGFIRTDMTADLDENMLKQFIPLGRFGKPDEVADLVSFLASEKSSYITGEVISVNGGIYT